MPRFLLVYNHKNAGQNIRKTSSCIWKWDRRSQWHS